MKLKLQVLFSGFLLTHFMKGLFFYVFGLCHLREISSLLAAKCSTMIMLTLSAAGNVANSGCNCKDERDKKVFLKACINLGGVFI